MAKARADGTEPGAGVDELAMSAWENDVFTLFRARLPSVFIQTAEEPRALRSVARAAFELLHRKNAHKMLFCVWSAVSCRDYDVSQLLTNPNAISSAHVEGSWLPSYTHSGGGGGGGDAGNGETAVPGLDAILREFQEAPYELNNPSDGNKQIVRTVLVLADVNKFIVPDQPGVVRLIKETLWAIRGQPKTLVLIGLPFALPDELASDVLILPFELPTAAGIEKELIKTIQSYKHLPRLSAENVKEEYVPGVARACTGLTLLESLNVAALALVRHGGFDHRAVELALHEKAQIVKRSGMMEYQTCSGGLDQVGGLESIKKWVREQDRFFAERDAAKAYGVELPKGILIFGVPGSGKSLMARMLAAHWKLPLLKLDLGRVFGSLVGQSEGNLRQVFAVCAAVAPCVVFLDEVEKMLGGGSDRDGGTTERVKGAFMSWLQDKPEGIFVVGAGNNIEKFESEPALLRAGRFSSVWAVGYPNLAERIEILGIHLGKRGHAVETEIVHSVAEITNGYSGAELEQVVLSALSKAFSCNPRPAHPTIEIFTDAVQGIVPLIKTMREPMQKLVAWVKSGKAKYAGVALDDLENVSAGAGTGGSTGTGKFPANVVDLG